MCATKAPPLTMSWRHRTKLQRRSWSRAGWLRVCIVKWCRERRKEVESRPRIATQPNESTSNGAKVWISFVVFQGKASPFFLIELSHCITVPEFIQCITVYPLYYRLSNVLPFIQCITVYPLYYRFSWVYQLYSVFLEFIHYIYRFSWACCISRQGQSQCSEESSKRQRLEVWQHHQHFCHGSWMIKCSTRLWKMMKCWT